MIIATVVGFQIPELKMFKKWSQYSVDLLRVIAKSLDVEMLFKWLSPTSSIGLLLVHIMWLLE